ncbi:MAG TPA: amino acid permease [Bacteroidales bacterium]|nr:amino acid permease [Bacteroidales bacterium]
MISKEKITKISVTTATAIVIANMVGTGVFTSLGFQVMGVQSIFALLMLWVIGGILSFCGALSYSELGAAIPRSGGEYTYLSKIYHPAVGFLSGFVSVFVGFAAPIALAAMALGGYFCTVFPWFNPVWVGATVVVLITLVHSINLSIGSRFQNIVTSLKVLLILIFIVCGFVFGEHQPISVLPLQGSWKEIGSAAFAISLIFVSYAYSGWNASAYMAGEIENPQKNLPKSILSGTLIVMVLYILLNFIFLYTVPIAEMADSQGNPIIEIGALSAGKIFGNTGGNIMSLVISILLISTISSMVLAGPRVTMTIGEDIAALKFFARKNKKGIPVIAIILQSLIALILIFTSSFDAVLTYLGFTLTLFTTLTVLGLFILRINKPDLPRPFKAWGYPITPAIFILLNLGIIYHSLTSKLTESLAGLGTVLIGLVIFYITQYYSKKSIKTF